FTRRRAPRSPLFPTRRSSDLRLPRTERRGQLRPPLRPSEPPGCALWHIPVDSSHRTSYVLCVDRDPPSLGPLQTSRDEGAWTLRDRKSTRLNSSHVSISYAVS